jgi:fructokinase
VTRIIGIGLVALDVVVDETAGGSCVATAGGTCGNVLAILAWLGWHAAPVARLDDGANATVVREDLARLGVDTRWLTLEPRAPAPVFTQRVLPAAGGDVRHRFAALCVACGGRPAAHKHVVRTALQPVLAAVGGADFLLVDRPSPGAVLLAEGARERGVTIVYEPSARGSDSHMAHLAQLADVVKYSDTRLNAADRRVIEAACRGVEIETLGAGGVRWRTTGPWQHRPAPRVPVRDSTGAGDWMTAGLLLELAAAPAATGGAPPERDWDAILERAQALAAWSCRFTGARGAMSAATPDDALSGARPVRDRRAASPDAGGLADVDRADGWSCADCRPTSRRAA